MNTNQVLLHKIHPRLAYPVDPRNSRAVIVWSLLGLRRVFLQDVL